MTNDQNRIFLCGTVCKPPVFSHEVYGEKYFCTDLAVMRLSGQSDILPVIFSERLCDQADISVSERIVIEGQVRTYNVMQNRQSHLRLLVFCQRVRNALCDETDRNQVFLEGYVCKPPVYRVTPFNREITDLLIAVNRFYGKSDYIPVICWGRNAQYAEHFFVSDKLSLQGRLQSRVYQKKIDEETVVDRVTYEVSVCVINKAE